MNSPTRRAVLAFSLVEVLIVAVLLIALAAFLLPRYLGSGKTVDGKNAPTPVSRAKDTVCQSNLQQLRAGLASLKAGDPDGANPQSLAELKFPAETTKC